MKKLNAPIGASFVVMSSLFYASYGIWTKLMGNDFGGYMASGLRSILVVMILLIPMVLYKKFEPINWAKNKKYILGMIFVSMFVWGPLYWSILQIGLALSLTINYASIVLGMFFFGWLLHGEKFTKQKLIATVVGLIGLLFVFSPVDNDLAVLPLLAATLSGAMIGANVALTKNLSYNSTQSTLMLWVTSVLANMPLAFILREPAPSMDLPMKWLYLLIFAVASVVASWLLVTGLRHIEAGVAGILGLLEIVFGVIFGVVLFHEQLTITTLIGIGIILVAAAIPYWNEVRKTKVGPTY